MHRTPKNKITVLFFGVFVFITTYVFGYAETVDMGSYTVSVTAVAPDPPGLPPTFDTPKSPAPPGGGGAGGMISYSQQIQDSVRIRGYAYPKSIVSLLIAGKVETQVPTDAYGAFEIHLRDIDSGVYSFGIQAQDPEKRKSLLTTYSVYVTPGVTVLVDNIIVSPTITTNKTDVKKGDTITLFGYAVASTSILLSIKPPTDFLRYTKSLGTGAYSYDLDTSSLSLGDHTGKSKSIQATDESPFSDLVSFKVGSINRLRSANQNGLSARCVKPDLNTDGKINILDFSIMAFWYKRTGFPVKIDLNNDSKVDLSDISILAYCWTG